MNTNTFMIAATLASGISMVNAPTASAATIAYVDEIIGAANTQVANQTSGNVYQDFVGSDSALILTDPYNNTLLAGVASYVGVKAGSSATYNVSATDNLALLWGTPDSYNTLTFYFDGVQVDSVTGGEITPQALYGNTAAYVIISTETAFNSVVFASAYNSFEYAISNQDGGTPPLTPVPLPAAAPMLLAGIGALGLVFRRRKTA